MPVALCFVNLNCDGCSLESALAPPAEYLLLGARLANVWSGTELQNVTDMADISV